MSSWSTNLWKGFHIRQLTLVSLASQHPVDSSRTQPKAVPESHSCFSCSTLDLTTQTSESLIKRFSQNFSSFRALTTRCTDSAMSRFSAQ
nr:hypothetical protein CFP56_73413 [Quercus suber]